METYTTQDDNHFWSFLKWINTIERLPVCEVDFLIKHLDEIYFTKGESILSEGEVCKRIYFVKKGGVRIFYVNSGGFDVSSDYYFENSIFSAFGSFVFQTPSSENIIAVEDCQLLSISYSTCVELFNRHPVWQSISNKLVLQFAIKKLEREAMLLVDDYDTRFKKLFSSWPELFQRVGQKHIASYLKMTPETLSRVKRRVYKNK